jgi:hypothetical protein
MGGDLLLSLKMYGLVIIISMLVAALIRGIVITLSKLQKKQAAPAARAPAAATPAVAPDPAQHDIAVIAAALYAMVGAHRIVRVQDRRGAGWTAEGRFAHHTSHAIQRKPRNR